MQLPSGTIVYPSTKITKHFTWGEATKNGTRVPVDRTIENNIINAAVNLERVRDAFNKPIIVTSWYRDPISNRAVGGVRTSFHLRGYAIDFKIPGMRPLEIYEKLTHTHLGGLGCYPHSGFIHIDWRNWNGYRKGRWFGR